MALKPIGTKPGEVGLLAMPTTAEQAVELARNLVGAMLPLSVQSWLQDMETWDNVRASTGQKQPPSPQLTQAERAILRTNLQSLTEILKPAHTRKPGELETQVLKLLSAFNLYGGDEAKIRAQLAVWCDELEHFPMFAIRMAYRWAVRSESKLPSLSSFVADCRLAVGSDTLRRQRLLLELLNPSKQEYEQQT